MERLSDNVAPVEQQAGPAERQRGDGWLNRQAGRRWWWATVLEQLACALLALMMVSSAVITVLTIIGRALGERSLDFVWADEYGILMLNIVAFIGGAVAFRRRQYAAFNWFERLTTKRANLMLDSARDAVTFVLAVSLTTVSIAFAVRSGTQTDQYLHVSSFWMDLPLAIGAVLVVLFSFERLLLTSDFRLARLAVAVAVAAVLLIVETSVHVSAGPETGVIAICVLVLLLLACGLPLPFAFAAGSMVYTYLSGGASSFTPASLLDGTASFILVAIPFFLFTGLLMSEGGLSIRLADAIRLIVGRVPGSVLHVITVSMFIFSGISGSKAGDMAAVGKAGMEMAEREDYPVAEAVAVLAAGGAMGDTVPPSTGLIVLSSVTSLTVGSLFLGGLLPAVVMLGTLTILIWLRFRTKHVPRIGGTLAGKVRTFAAALPVMVLPVLLIGGIISGIATPTEASAIAVMIALVLCLVLYRSIRLKDAYKVLISASVLSGTILFIVATATLFARVLTLAEIPMDLTNLVTSGIFHNKWAFLICSTILIILMGQIMEGLPAILVFAPLLLPLATSLGINGLQYGIIMVMAMGIGVHSPPIGVGLFVGAQIGDVPVRDAGRRMRPYLIALYAGLAILLVVPQISTWLPDVFHVT